jgi:ABC-2 type transport system permease protein
VVTAKLVFALLIGVPVAAGLVALSGLMLRLPLATVIYQALVTVCLGLGLASAALGLGAKLADYAEDNPAKLVAGYGGTVNLLASLIFTGLMLIGAALPLFFTSPPWLGWSLGIAWTLVLTTWWSASFLRLAWRCFGTRSA